MKNGGVINARRKAMAYPGTRSSPVREIIHGEKLSLRGDTSLAIRIILDSATKLIRRITLFQLSTEARHRGGLFIARDKDLVNYLLPIYNILFATGGCCATAGRDECGFTQWWLWRRKEEREEKRNGRTEHELLYDRSLRECETRRAYE